MLRGRSRGQRVKLWILLQSYGLLFTYAQGTTESSELSFSFVSEPVDSQVPPGGDVTLQCAVSAGAAVRWRWAAALPLDEAPLLEEGPHRSQLANGSLRLTGIGADGSPTGDYQCVATLPEYGTILSRIATVSIPTPPIFDAEPRDLVVYPGQPAFLACNVRPIVHKYKNPVPLSRIRAPLPPDLRIQWLKNEAPMRLDETRMSQLPSGALEIDPAGIQDKGTYRCNVSRVGGSSSYRLSNKATLTINTDLSLAETVTAPTFIAEPRSQTVIEGSPVAMDCAALGNPRPEIIWLNNGVAIDLNDLDSRFVLLGSGVLYINSVRESDAGTYQCRADNREDALDATAILDVQVPPRFIKKPSDKTALEREDLLLECEVYGRPEPTVRWLKNGEVLTPNNHDMAYVGGYNLRIQGLMALDAGMFQCVASNPAGNIQASARLTVLSAAKKIVLPKRAKSKNSKSKKSKSASAEDQYFSDDFNSFEKATNAKKLFDSRSILTSLKSSEMGSQDLKRVSQKRDGPNNGTKAFLNSRYSHDIFSSLVSTDERQANPETTEDILDESDDELGVIQERDAANINLKGFLGPISKAFTSTTLPNGGFETENHNLDVEEDDDESGPLPDPLTGIASSEGPSSVGAEAPSEPLELRAVIVKPRFVTLSWKKPLETNGDITVYAVIFNVLGSIRERVMNTTRGDVHEMNLSALEPNTVYQFRVVAYNVNGPGPSTQVLEITTQSEEQFLNSPQEVTVLAVSPTSLAVSWKPPQPARVAVERYQLLWTELETEEERSVTTTELSERIVDLRPFTEYGIRVSALAAGEEGRGAGAFSDIITVKTPGDQPSAPPNNFTVEPATSTSVKASWEAPPVETQNGYITGFKLKYRRAGKRKADSLATPADTRSIVLQNLDSMATYQVRICAFNINGSGPFTEWVTVETLQNDLDESQVPDQPSPLTTRPSSDSIFVSWSPPAGNQNIRIRGYSLAWGKGIPDVFQQGLSESTRHYTIRNLDPNSEYVISLRAMNNMGEGPTVYANVQTRDRSDPVLSEREPDLLLPPGGGGGGGGGGRGGALPLQPPVGLKAVTLSGSTAVLYWSDNTLLKSEVTDHRYYVVRYSILNSQRHRYVNTTHLNCMVDELRPNTQYEFTVKVVKGNRESPWSMVVVNGTQEVAPGSSPRDLRVSPSSDGSIVLHWLAPNKANGAITGYVILYTADKQRRDRDWVVQAVLGGGVSAPVRGLRPSTPYHFKVQARNARGYGPFSPVVTFTTPPESRHGPSTTIYLAVAGTILFLVLAGGLALFLCCRRSAPDPIPSPAKSTYQKSSASNIKPPDLWIHHDQMELKQMDKSHHSSTGSGDGVSAMTLPRPSRDSCEYETALPGGGVTGHSQGSLDKRHYVPTYVGSTPCSDTSGLSSRNSTIIITPMNMSSSARSSQASKPLLAASVDHFNRELSMSSINTCGMGSIGPDPTGMRAPYPRSQYLTQARTHINIDQNTPLLSAPGSSLSGTLASQSSISSLGQMHHHHSTLGSIAMSPMSCSGMSCVERVGSIGGPGALIGVAPSPAPSPASEGFPADAREREQGHYVAYEALHPPRDSLEAGGAAGSLGRNHPGGHHPLRSFSVPAPPPSDAPHTPHHHPKVSVTIRPTNTSPYKKPVVPAQPVQPMPNLPIPMNRLQQGLAVPHSAEEREALAPSSSTERLHQDMANLEGLMKDLHAISANQFQC